MTTAILPGSIAHVTIAEIRMKLTNAGPSGGARLEYFRADGAPAGDVIFSEWSADTWELLKELTDSIEQDFALAVAGEMPSDPDEDDSITY